MERVQLLKGRSGMKRRILLAGAVFACGFAVSVAQAASQNEIILAQNDRDRDQRTQSHPSNPPPDRAGGQQYHMGGTMMMGRHDNNTGNHNNNMMMGGHNDHMGGSTMMNGRDMGHSNMGAPRTNFDRHSFQRNFKAPRRYHANGYARPSGWYSHRWVYGEILPSLFWAQTYWLTDYGDYGLPPPPPGFVWVRDGDDALLVDTSSGEILQVEYGVFY
jgi:Ni/Co efflux regulator RcnB